MNESEKERSYQGWEFRHEPIVPPCLYCTGLGVLLDVSPCPRPPWTNSPSSNELAEEREGEWEVLGRVECHGFVEVLMVLVGDFERILLLLL